MTSVPGDDEQPLVEHIKELRRRMLFAVIPIIVITLVVFMFSGGLLKAMWNSSVPVPMYIYSPLELITTEFTFSLVCALFIGIPLMVYELFMFVGKGLYMNEKKFFIRIVPLSFVLFFAGAALAYFIVVPIVFKSAMVYSMDIAVPQNRALKTFYSIMTLVVSFGIFFQFPLLILSALKMKLLKRQTLQGQRKIIYGALLAVALLVSAGPDMLSGLIMAALLVMLFEASLMVSRYF
ncbi:MAG: twin-arginine translocase subunit TatC [Candidatus Methanoperedens sp.]|nr:twin-arginine translocase subunit TatC [Candidatus Methanoperedens sp.]